MAPLGPMVVVAEHSASAFIDVLEKAGAFPVVDATWADAPAAITEIQPAALLLAEPEPCPDASAVETLLKKIESRGAPFMPVLARVDNESDMAISDALPVTIDEAEDRLIARLRWALRVRTLHATVIRRSGAEKAQPKADAALSKVLDDATVICLGRGRSYPALTTALGERVGLIGAFSVETAGRYLNARDIDGIVVGDGFGPRVVETLLTVLADDRRFRDLPVGVLGSTGVDDERLPNLVRVENDPALLLEHLLPLVRIQAFETHLKRQLKSFETDGLLDPETGLLGHAAFWRDLERAVHEAENGRGCLSIARFSFEDLTDRRVSIDAARLFSRLVRDVDFACREQDGSIIAAFTETNLGSAHG